MINNSHKHSRGFTIIELSLAVIFVAILLLLVATVTIRIGGLYEKGVTVKTLNQVGREVMDNLRRDIAQSANRLEFKAVGTGASATYRLCLGNVSYIANSGESLNAAVGTKVAYTDNTPVVFARVVGKAAATFCDDMGTGTYETTVGSTVQAKELLTTDGTEFVVHDLSVTTLSQTASQSLYKLTLVIGTNEAGTLDSNRYCLPGTDAATEYNANYNYCSVAEFTTIIRSGGTDG